MCLNSTRPDSVEIRKVWVAGGEAFVAEISVDGTDEINRMLQAVSRGKQARGFCPSKPESPAYEITVYEGDSTESVTVESGCLHFDDGDNEQLPDQGMSLMDILDRLLEGVEVSRLSVSDIFSQMGVTSAR